MENTLRVKSMKDYISLETLRMSLRSSLISFLLRSQDLNGLVLSLSIDSVDLTFICSSENTYGQELCVFHSPIRYKVDSLDHIQISVSCRYGYPGGHPAAGWRQGLGSPKLMYFPSQ